MATGKAMTIQVRGILMTVIRFEELQEPCPHPRLERDPAGYCLACGEDLPFDEDCEQAQGEAAWDRFVEAYYGGEVATDQERYVQAWKLKRASNG